MYWKILTAVLCFYAVVPVPPTTTTAANTTTTADNTTTTAANTTTTAANTTTTADNTTTTAANTTTTAANITTTAVPTTTTATPTTKPPPLVVLNLVFSSDEVFNPVLTNTSSPLFQSQVNKTLNAFEPLFKARFRNFIRMIVLGFRSGSIITVTQLEFAADNTTANATTPGADAVAATLKDAIANGSLSINISSTFNVTVQPTPTTAAPTPTREAPTTTRANNTTTTAANTTTTAANTTTTAANTTTTAVPTTSTATPTTKPPPLVVFNLVFRSDEVFNPVLTNTSSPLFQSQVKKTLNALEPLFKGRFRNFIRMIVLGFRSGSIITDTQLEFAADNTTANATTFADVVTNTLKAAIADGSLSINISSTFNITVVATPTTEPSTTTTGASPSTTTTGASPPTTTTGASPPTTTTGASPPTTTTAAPPSTTTTAAPSSTTTTGASPSTTTTGAPITTTAAFAPTTTAAPNVLLLVFSSDEVFVNSLSNNTSKAFRERAAAVKNAIEPLYRKVFRSFIQLVVLRFRSGSIVTYCRMEFGLTGNGTAPTANLVKNVLADAVKNGKLSIRVNENSITVTEEQIEYFIVNSSMSAVVNSVLSSFGMTLVFLLLSAAMHIL